VTYYYLILCNVVHPYVTTHAEGGVFIFKGESTVYAYYDAAAGTHLEVAKAVDKALEVATR
jgi:hypothetical protein